MAEYGKVENPTLNVKDYMMGDFVYWLMYDVQPSFAVVVETNGKNVQLRHFEDGFPFELSGAPEYGSMRKASRDESVDHFHKISEKFERKFETGGLSGAISARRQHYLNGIISQLEECGRDTFYAATIDPKDPMTGTYVLMGIYSGQGPSEHLEGLVAVPRLSEETVSRVMKDINPNGFGKIPRDVYNTPSTSHGSLVAYCTYEVPEKALGLVESPKKLELRLY